MVSGEQKSTANGAVESRRGTETKRMSKRNQDRHGQRTVHQAASSTSCLCQDCDTHHGSCTENTLCPDSGRRSCAIGRPLSQDPPRRGRLRRRLRRCTYRYVTVPWIHLEAISCQAILTNVESIGIAYMDLAITPIHRASLS